jgi:UDP-N-acetylglucosamine acyltransferase
MGCSHGKMTLMSAPARAITTTVHPTAIVHPEAILESGVTIGPFCIVEQDTHVGAGTTLEAGAQVRRYTRLGRDNRIGTYAIIGGEPMDLKFKGELSALEIGDRNTIREFTTIHRACGEGEITRIGNDNFITAYVHITHNCIVGDWNVITNSVQIAGHVVIEHHVTIGVSVGVHQFSRIGAHAMVGMNSKVTRDVLPYSLVDGHPAAHYGLNAVGLKRRNIRGEDYALLQTAFKALRNGESLEAFNQDANRSKHLADFLEFVNLPSIRGLSSFAGKG